MNIRFFASLRLDFIKQFYATCSAHYIDLIRKIDAEEAPFVPQHDEGEEPTYAANWLEAEESLHILAYTCISMLAATLSLYFETWVSQSGRPISEELKKGIFSKKGRLAGYTAHFLKEYDIDLGNAPVDYKLLEEVILARNIIEHPPYISSMRTQFSSSDLCKINNPFFINVEELNSLRNTTEGERVWLIPPTLHVTGPQLAKAISEIERLINWFEPIMKNSCMTIAPKTRNNK